MPTKKNIVDDLHLNLDDDFDFIISQIPIPVRRTCVPPSSLFSEKFEPFPSPTLSMASLPSSNSEKRKSVSVIASPYKKKE